MPARPRLLLLMPEPRRSEVFSAEALARLRALGDLTAPEGDTTALTASLPELLGESEVAVTGWGAPPLLPDLLASASRLRLIAHSAGSIRSIVPIGAFERGIVVCHAADVIAEAVCEATLLLILTGLRRFHEMDRALKAGGSWGEAGSNHFGHQLSGRTVGLIGCGHVARRVIALLKPFLVRILVYDPFLTDQRAAELGVVRASLEEVLGAEVVSNHAPVTPETRHMLGARELALIRDDAVFVNTARAWAIDQVALLAELRTGRFWAALDVFDREPLPEDSPLRGLDNVFLTPHRAGQTRETYLKQGAAMVDEVERYLSGQPLLYRVQPEQYQIMA
jgi:phosphoglycerate dehydrogenase-like enzyme